MDAGSGYWCTSSISIPNIVLPAWEATQWFLNIVYIICCKKIIMQALVMQFGKNVGTSLLYVCAEFVEYSLRAVVNGL